VLIRHADPARDAAACAQIYAPYVTDTVISLEEKAPDEQRFAERIRRLTLTHPWLVAETGGAIVGYAYASPHHERAAYRWAADVAAYVRQGQHRRGTGRALYQALFELLVRQGVHVACAGVTLPNAASVGLHESLGFKPVGVYRRIGFKHGRWHDVGWWQLDLVAPSTLEPAEPGPPTRLW
jgi:L-amino acid N-acyltransferase YncA